MRGGLTGNTRSLFVVAAFFIGEIESQAAWNIEPVDLSGEVGWSLSIDTDPAGEPHAAYFTTNPNGYLQYASRGASGWVRGPAIEFGNAFALDNNGQRFFVNEPRPNFYPHFQVLLDNGLLLGQQLAATRISEDVFLDFDSQNQPHIGWVDTSARQLKHSFWDGTSWTTRTVATNPQFQYGNSSFVATMDDNEQLHFAWKNDVDRVQYAKPNGTTWQISSPFPTRDAFPYDIDVDASGNVHLAYDVSTGNVHTGGLFYGKFDGTSWTGGRVSGLDNFGGGRSRLVADEAGMPHIFTYDSTFSGPENLKHVYLEGDAWANETIDSYTSGVSGPDAIEVLLNDDGFHVLYATGNKEIYYATQSTASGLDGDYTGDGIVDAADFVAWRKGMNAQYSEDNYNAWRTNFGLTTGAGAAAGSLTSAGAAIPEPATLLLAVAAALGF
ncbi:MAG TPA: hypothetical protein VGK58_23440, partial [Lacipirellulaceae bacterium]